MRLAGACTRAKSVSLLHQCPREARHGRCQLMDLLHPAPGNMCRLTGWVLVGVSHVVGQTLGSHAYRIGGGGACYFSSSWKDSPFTDVPFEMVFGVGSEVLVCWLESQVWKSLSL